jgi:hypothetical protein
VARVTFCLDHVTHPYSLACIARITLRSVPPLVIAGRILPALIVGAALPEPRAPRLYSRLPSQLRSIHLPRHR